MEEYPNWRKGIRVGAITGAIAGVIAFVACIIAARSPAATDVSICWSFRPWWRLSNWIESGIVAISFFIVMGFLEAFHPENRKRKIQPSLGALPHDPSGRSDFQG